jgi:hypothetical protein
MPEQRIVVERHLGIERDHAIILGHHQRIDLHHAGVEIAKGAVGAHDCGHRAADLLDVEPESERDLARLERLQPHGRLDDHLQDGSGRLGDLLDLHAALGRGDDAHAFRLAVEHHAKVDLALEFLGHLDIDALHDLALGTGLAAVTSLLAEHALRRVVHLVIGPAQLDAAGLAAGAGVDLRLDGPVPAAQLRCDEGRLVGAVGHRAALDRHAIARQQLLGLVLVNVQLAPPECQRRAAPAAAVAAAARNEYKLRSAPHGMAMIWGGHDL